MDEQPANVFWMIGRGPDGQWQQRLVVASDLQHAEGAWQAEQGSPAEIAISRQTLEDGVGAWLDLEDGLVLARAGRLFGAWIAREGRMLLVPIQALDEAQAQAQLQALNPGSEQAIVVPALALMEALAGMRDLAYQD